MTEQPSHHSHHHHHHSHDKKDHQNMTEQPSHHSHHHHHHSHDKKKEDDSQIVGKRPSKEGELVEPDHKKNKNEALDPAIVGWTSLFTHTKASAICHHTLYTVRTHDSVSHLLKVLSERNVLSCPVLNPSTHEFAGFVDTLDVAGWVLATWKKHSRELERGKFPSQEFFEAPVEKILNFSRVDPTVAVTEDTSLLDLVDTFTDPNNFHRLHRVAVVNKDKNLVGIISQSDIIRFAYQNLSMLPKEVAQKKIGELKLGRSLIFVRLDSPFIDTLETLYQNRISGLALVDEEFHLSGNISTSDLRGMSPGSFDYFLGSTLQFLVKGRKGPIKPPTSMPLSATLEDVLKSLHENKIHRVYLTNEYDRPQTVVSLGDIIARII